jgi:hypothetical protein
VTSPQPQPPGYLGMQATDKRTGRTGWIRKAYGDFFFLTEEPRGPLEGWGARREELDFERHRFPKAKACVSTRKTPMRFSSREIALLERRGRVEYHRRQGRAVHETDFVPVWCETHGAWHLVRATDIPEATQSSPDREQII